MPLTEYDDTINKTKTSNFHDAASVLSALELDSKAVKDELSAFETADLSNDDEAAIGRSLNKAALWLITNLRPANEVLEDYLPKDTAIVQEIVIKRAVSELTDYSGQTELSKEKRIMAERLAQALFGAAFPTEAEKVLSPASGAIVRPSRRPPCRPY